jgi:hypothetical protein
VKENSRLLTQRLDVQLEEGKLMMKRGMPSISIIFTRYSTRCQKARKLYADYEERVAKKENKKKAKGEDDASVNHVIGGDPPNTPSPSSSSSSSSSSSHSHHSSHSHYSNFHPSTSKKSLLKLDVKFNFPMFNGEANVDKLKNWIR